MTVDARDAEIEKLKNELAAIKKVYERLMLEYERLRRNIIGPKREQAPKAQLSILELLDGIVQLQRTGDVDDAQALLDRVRAESGAEPANTAADATSASESDKAKASESDKAKDAESDKKKQAKSPHGRRKQRVVDDEVIIEPAERLAPGGELLERIGEDTHVIFERRRAHVVRLLVRYPKYKSRLVSTMSMLPTSRSCERRRSRRRLPRACWDRCCSRR